MADKKQKKTKDGSVVSGNRRKGKMGVLVYAESTWRGDKPYPIFLEKEHAKGYAHLNKAVRSAEGSGITWGEFEDREPDAYYKLIEDCWDLELEEWLNQIEKSDNKLFLELKDDPKKAKEAFCEEVSLPERMPFDDEIFSFNGNFADSVEFMLTFGGEGNMSSVIPKDVIAKYGRVEESMWGDEYILLESQYLEEIISELERRGYKCEENGDLVAGAVGWL
jgi:hypothetical protein